MTENDFRTWVNHEVDNFNSVMHLESFKWNWPFPTTKTIQLIMSITLLKTPLKDVWIQAHPYQIVFPEFIAEARILFVWDFLPEFFPPKLFSAPIEMPRIADLSLGEECDKLRWIAKTVLVIDIAMNKILGRGVGVSEQDKDLVLKTISSIESYYSDWGRSLRLEESIEILLSAWRAS